MFRRRHRLYIEISNIYQYQALDKRRRHGAVETVTRRTELRFVLVPEPTLSPHVEVNIRYSTYPPRFKG